MAQKLALTYPKQSIDTKTSRWNDVIGYCPSCRIETVISGYTVSDNELVQECCRTCGSWWNIHRQTLITDATKGNEK